jgi:hypothetical protein
MVVAELPVLKDGLASLRLRLHCNGNECAAQYGYQSFHNFIYMHA